jgi:hypothetical protein
MADDFSDDGTWEWMMEIAEKAWLENWNKQWK